MKPRNVVVLGLGWMLSACQSEVPAGQAVVLDPQTVRVGPIRHDSLTSAQVARITRIQATFAEVVPASLAETLNNFRRDADPDREIAVWETMAAAYERYLRRQPRLSFAQKKEVFALLLSRSMMPAAAALANANPVRLTPTEAQQVLAEYEAAPAPLTVQ
ncbi:hypothetical protein LJ737_13430 [Hymenobacter sp. 15J16-1T3B]|uniref:hypothetical protein n=1 Tax=Hymenobacter sp. 15J16-1T3B TaxID=2886941 RepID=UPI001D108B12|nr:hypothetical protein [Hymenobacter sp. 15J16-1T3B]MCC3158244.1 hypothetical protein [Hymenobacter sp. 15J16-1T3B]